MIPYEKVKCDGCGRHVGHSQWSCTIVCDPCRAKIPDETEEQKEQRLAEFRRDVAERFWRLAAGKRLTI